MNKNVFNMRGTESTGTYVGFATDRAQIGYRDIGGGSFRVRIEPNDADAAADLEDYFPRADGWKQPGEDNQNRFSKVIGADALQALMTALLDNDEIGGVCDISQGEYTPPSWMFQAANTDEIGQFVNKVRALKLPGCNLASNWSLDCLRTKVQKA